MLVLMCGNLSVAGLAMLSDNGTQPLPTALSIHISGIKAMVMCLAAPTKRHIPMLHQTWSSSIMVELSCQQLWTLGMPASYQITTAISLSYPMPFILRQAFRFLSHCLLRHQSRHLSLHIHTQSTCSDKRRVLISMHSVGKHGLEYVCQLAWHISKEGKGKRKGCRGGLRLQ